jgi:hypothetical protein
MSEPEFLYRTVPFKNFQSQVGFSVTNLNTVIVGLAAVGSGIAQKPDGLAVSWPGGNRPFLAAQARQFATKSLMVYAVDALDKYIGQVGLDPCLITDQSLRSILVREPQVTSAQSKNLPASELTELAGVLNHAGSDEIINRVVGFANKFGSKKRPPHIRARLDALSNKFPAPAYYLAAVRLLVSWRNRHVHQSGEKITAIDEAELVDNKAIFWDQHSHTDISTTLDHYRKGRGPTLKDISTLVSVLQRTVRTIDETIIAACDINEFARQSLQQAFKEMSVDEAKGHLKQLWGLGTKIRQRKLTAYLRNFGFQPKKKDGADGRQLPAEFFDELLKLERSEACSYLGI